MGVLENINPKKTYNSDKGVRAASSKHQPAEGEVLANVNTFAITRLVETALVNISRIELIWKILVPYILFLYLCVFVYRLPILIFLQTAKYRCLGNYL